MPNLDVRWTLPPAEPWAVGFAVLFVLFVGGTPRLNVRTSNAPSGVRVRPVEPLFSHSSAMPHVNLRK